jgi:lysozyme
MSVNEATIDLITEFEGVVLEAYPDPAHGWRVPTIGIGHTTAAGPPEVKQGMKITEKEAREMLVRDLAKYESAVNRLVKVPLTANQYGALTSFTFNLGEGNLAKSTLLKKLNAGDYAGAAKEFPRWNKAGGKVMNGLTRRRKAEAELFLKPDGKYAPPHDPIVIIDEDPIIPQQTWWQKIVAAIADFLLSLLPKGK